MTRIGLATFLVDNYDSGIEFFTTALGFVLVEDTVISDTKRWVVVAPSAPGSTGLLLAQPGDEVQTAAVGQQAGGRVAFFLYTDNFDRDSARMIDAGVQFQGDTRNEPYGRVVVFEDCSGNRWDLIERLERAASATKQVD